MKHTSKSATRRRHTAPLTVVLAIAALLALPLAASALHWPNFGGDAGHSGNQVLRAAEMGIEHLYRQTDAGAIRTSLVTSGGDDVSGQRVSYGKFIDVGSTANDQTRIHIRDLATGAEKVPEAQQVIDDDANGDGAVAGSDDRALGTGNEFVTPVSSSGHGSLGQLYVVHNDENSTAAADNGCDIPTSVTDSSQNDLAIAHFDEATGAQKADFAIGQAQGDDIDPTCTTPTQISDGFAIESSPVLTPPLDAGGRRYLFFVAKRDAGGDGRLFRVEINNAGSPSAVVGFTSPAVRDIPNLNTKASPSIAYLRDPASGFVLPYVVVAVNAAAGASDIRAFKAADIGADEVDIEVPVDIPGNPQTVSVPVSEDGELPGPRSGDEKAPALYAAYHEAGPTVSADDDVTRVYRFTQTGNNAELTPTVVTPPALDGAPAPGLALSTVVAGDAEQRDCAGALQCVIVTTGENLFVLDPSTLAPVERLRDAGETLLQPGVNGFARNVPLTSGGFVFVQDDGGIPYVLDLDDAERVPETDFVPELTSHLESDFAFGQPSYSNGFLQFLTDRGLFVYQTGIFFPPNERPTASFTVTPNPATVNQAVTFDASNSSDPDETNLTYEWDFDGDGTFEVNRGSDSQITVSFPVPRTYDVSLRVTDEALERTSPQSDTATVPVVINPGPPPPPNVPPTATFSASPSPATVNRQVVFDGSASRDPDGSIVQYEWDLDGNGSFETNSGSNPRTQRAYATPNVYNVKLRVSDNLGARTETVRQLTVTSSSSSVRRVRPRSLSATTKPSRDRTLPYVFKTSGRLRLPSGIARTDGCNGRVKITFKVGKKTISARTTKLRSRCTYRTSVTFRDRKRIGTATRLRVIVRFQGNKVLTPKSARTRSVRVG